MKKERGWRCLASTQVICHYFWRNFYIHLVCVKKYMVAKFLLGISQVEGYLHRVSNRFLLNQYSTVGWFWFFLLWPEINYYCFCSPLSVPLFVHHTTLWYSLLKLWFCLGYFYWFLDMVLIFCYLFRLLDNTAGWIQKPFAGARSLSAYQAVHSILALSLVVEFTEYWVGSIYI